MKRLSIIVVVLLLFGPIFWCSAIGFGGFLASSPELIEDGSSAAGERYLHVPTGVGLFADVPNGRFYTAITGAWAAPFSAYEIEIAAMVRSTIPLWIVNLSPSAGILYQMPLWGDADGDGQSDLESYTPEEINDLYILLGLSVEMDIAPQLYLQLSAYWGINLLVPNPATDTLSAPHPALSGNFVTVQLGVGYIMFGTH